MRFGDLRSIETERPQSPYWGSPNEDDIYRAVGLALTQWETLEEHLAYIFGAYHGFNTVGLERAYGLVQGTSTRIKMLRASAEARFANDDACREEHLRAINVIEKLCVLRNDIAHGKVTLPSINGEVRGFLLLPPSHSSQKNFSPLEYVNRKSDNAKTDLFLDFLKSRYKYFYSATEVIDISQRFAAASVVCGKVWASMLIGNGAPE